MTWRFSTVNVGTQPGGSPPVDPGGVIDFTAETIGAATLESADGRYYRNSSKVLVSASANQPRFHCDTYGRVQGLLIEGPNVGLLKNNRTFTTGAGWTFNEMTTVSSARSDIFGGNAAYEFRETNANAHHGVFRAIATPDEINDNIPICIWAIVEYVNMPYVLLMFRDKANRFPWQRFNINPESYAVHTAFPGDAIQYTAGVKYLGSNRLLIWASYNTSSATTPTNVHWRISTVNADGSSHVYAGSNRSFILHAGGANVGYYPQMYFAVGDSWVQKAGDRLTLPVTEQSANDFYRIIKFIAPPMALMTGSVARRCLYQSGNFYVSFTDAAIYAGFGGNEIGGAYTFIPGSRYSVRVGKGPTKGLELWVNDTLVASNAGAAFRADITPGTIHIGCDANGQNQIDGGIIESIELGAWE